MMKLAIAGLALLALSACAVVGHKNNINLIESDITGVGQFGIDTGTGTPRFQGAGQISHTALSGPMVREDSEEGDFTALKTSNWCGSEDYVSYMINVEGTAQAEGLKSLGVAFNKGIYGGQVAQLMGIAAVAAAMNGEEPSFLMDCSETTTYKEAEEGADDLGAGGAVGVIP